MLGPFVAALLLACAWLPAQAGLLEGMAAYKRGEYPAAYRQLLPAAEGGYPVAQYYVGRMLDDGNGVPRDRAAAAEWYRKAAERGHPDAQHRLGKLYLWGYGLRRSAVEALRWQLRAAEQGHAEAQATVGQLYADGAKGVSQDPVLAWKWLTLAGRGGEAIAALQVPAVERQMSARQLARARRLVAGFRSELE